MESRQSRRNVPFALREDLRNWAFHFHVTPMPIPKGRNAGWSAYLYYGFDEAMQRDARRFAPVRGRSDLFSGNIQYKLNPWVTFAFEQGYYRTRAANRSALDFGGLPLFRGVPSYTTHNVRSEFATIFTF